MEVSALKYPGGLSLHGRSPLLRLQSDERLIAYLRKGNMAAFEVLVSRYETRLLAFCRHLLGSREDAEDVLQEVMTAAFNAILADERPINVRPWLYRIARNRSLNHLRRIQAIGVDSMDMHYFDNGASTADKVHEREEFRLLVGDIHELPETQKTALVLREMDALSYDQIAEAMETTVPSVKSLLVRARVSLAEAAEARLLSCDEVRIELGEVAEGLRRRPSPLVRRHLRACERCTVFRGQLRETNKALAALMPIGPLVILKKLALAHLGHSAGAGSSATAAGSSAASAAGAGAGAGAAGAGAGAAAGGTALAGSGVAAGSGGFISAGLGAIATKAAAGLAAAAIVTAGAVEAEHSTTRVSHRRTTIASLQKPPQPPITPIGSQPEPRSTQQVKPPASASQASKPAPKAPPPANTPPSASKAPAPTPTTSTTTQPPAPVNSKATPTPTGRDQTQQDPTVMAPTGSGVASTTPTTAAQPTSAAPVATPGAPTTTATASPPPTTGTDSPPPTDTPPPTTGTPPPTTGTGSPPTTTPPAPPVTDPTPPAPSDPGTGDPPPPTTNPSSADPPDGTGTAPGS
jgi:RNA polymerase sigma factor (sigma-70 family)